MIANRVPFAERATIRLLKTLLILLPRHTILLLSILLIHFGLYNRHNHILLIQRKLLNALDNLPIELSLVMLVQLSGLVV